MDVKDKTKDNVKARKDLEQHCSRPELHLIGGVGGKIYKPKAAYTLSKVQMTELCVWAKSLKLPEGYSANISRCVNESSHKFSGMKSHDCHIFMQRLLPVAFRDLLPKSIWEVLTELSNYFKDICATVLRVEHMEQIELNIVEILCKLERIFPPAFFDSMEHLPIHLAYEAKVGGRVQYRWMYPFERFLYHLKKKVGNRARVEALIVEAYIIEEVSTFCASYFEPQVQSRLNRVPRNDDGGSADSSCRLSIFTHPGRALGSRFTTRYLKDDELKAAHRYILMNCEKINPFLAKFTEEKKQQIPGMTDKELQILCDQQFPPWLLSHIQEHPYEVDDDIKKLAHGPNRRVSCYNGYFVNVFKFETVEHGRYKATSNYGVCVLGSTTDEYEVDYYGVLEEILGLEYYGLRDVIVLFRCHWYDTSDKGVKVHRLGIVEINNKSKLNTNDPFLLSSQAQQVYYTVPPTIKQVRNNWMVVCKVKARGKFEIPLLEEQEENVPPNVESAFQEEEIFTPHPIIIDANIDEVNIFFNEEDELDSVELEELRRAANDKQVISDGEELEEELEDFESDEETQEKTDHDTDNSANEMENED
ncbi:uncharacterized protein [Henckelia pumila]|uniref:uncharacterized protein n=1 Tax=Henckelia pumila TaxID=405737 RepID=UPI003C6E3B71